MSLFTIKNWFKPKPTIWISSDLHFSHKSILGYCDRPWIDIETMNQGLIDIWNSTVKENDTVYILGDFSLNPNVMIKITPQLKGKKILIPGNHDACFAWNGRANEKKLKKYTDAGWEVHQTLELKLKNKVTVLMSHLPYPTEWSLKHDSRYLEYRPKDNGLFLLHGHLHGKYVKQNNCIDVGIDNNFKLYSEDDIINLMNDKRDFIPSRLTGRKPKGEHNES